MQKINDVLINSAVEKIQISTGRLLRKPYKNTSVLPKISRREEKVIWWCTQWQETRIIIELSA